MVRDGGFADPDQFGDVADAQLARREHVENPHARGIAKHSEGFGERFDRRRRHQMVAPIGGQLAVNVRPFAGVHNI